MKDFIAPLFGFGMIGNALLFVPQVVGIWRSRRAEGISLITFLGFNAMQLVGVIHGVLQKDWALTAGMGASLLTCGAVTLGALVFRKGAAAASV